MNSSNENKKAEIRAVEFEHKEQWLKAAQQHELAGLSKKAAKCRAKEFEKGKQWVQAAEQYELAGMLEKAEECRKKIKYPSHEVKIPKTPNANNWKNSYEEKRGWLSGKSNIAEDLNQELIDLGVIKIGENGKYRATEALRQGYIPGWQYDSKEKLAYFRGSALKIKLEDDDFEDKNQNLKPQQK